VVELVALPPPLDEPPPPPLDELPPPLLDDEPPPDVPHPVMLPIAVRLSSSSRRDANVGLRRRKASRPMSPPASAMPEVGMRRAAVEPVVVIVSVVLMVLPPVTVKVEGEVLQVGGVVAVPPLVSFTEQLVVRVPETPGAMAKVMGRLPVEPDLMVPRLLLPPVLVVTEATPEPLRATVVVGVTALVVKVSVPL